MTNRFHIRPRPTRDGASYIIPSMSPQNMRAKKVPNHVLFNDINSPSHPSKLMTRVRFPSPAPPFCDKRLAALRQEPERAFR
jgi:hypothetical protein